MSRARVLFVDDEPRILDGLRRSLRGKRGDWDMSFAPGGEAALDLLAGAPYDVVVSDMRMPGMDGAELLTRVSQQYPEVARVVLSGHTEREAAMKVAIAGHRFLSKPTEPEQLVEVIEQLNVRTSSQHGCLARRIAGAARSLPALPALAADLGELLAAGEVDINRLVRAVVHDTGLTAKLLQLSNSGFFGARPRNASVAAVVSAIGVPAIQALAAAGSAYWSATTWQPTTEEYMRGSLRHALATAWLIEKVASPAHRPYGQAAALLQDIGRLAAIAAWPPSATNATDPGVTHHEGVTFREVGVELLHLWGLPAPIVGAVAGRDTPHHPPHSGLGVTGALRAAHLLIQQTESRDPAATVDDEEMAVLLAHPQLAAQHTDWQRAAQEASVRAGDLLSR